MNIKLIVGVLLGVAIIGGGAYLINKNKGEIAPHAESEATAEENGLRDHFAALVRSGRDLECTFDYDDGQNASHGVVYMAAGANRLRIDFNVTKGPGVMEGHIMRDDGINYTWSSLMPQGIKMAVADNEVITDQQNGEASVNDNVEYDCHSWRVDESKFVLPADITFQDMTAFQAGFSTNGSASGTVDIKTQQCAACGMISDAAAAAQCRAALACN